MLHPLIAKYADDIRLICANNHIKQLFFFGSILDDSRFNKDSDIDILVDFKEDEITLEEYTQSYFNLLFALEDLLGRTIDITTFRSVKNPYFQSELEATRELFYESLTAVNG